MAEKPTITSEQGIKVIEDMMKTLDGDPQLRRSSFGRSVRLNLIEMKAGFRDGRRMTIGRQMALENWGVAINRSSTRKAAESIQ